MADLDERSYFTLRQEPWLVCHQLVYFEQALEPRRKCGATPKPLQPDRNAVQPHINI